MNYRNPASWLSWKGRANRLPYWLALLTISGLTLSLQAVPEEGSILGLFLLPLFLVGIYVYLVLAVKHAHDTGRSGYFVLLLFIPIISIWPGIELAFSRGTSGPNNYGEDPLVN